MNSRAKLLAINRTRQLTGAVRAAEVKALHSELGSASAVARKLGLSRRTIRDLLSRSETPTALKPQPMDANGRPRRMPTESELDWRIRWRRHQLDSQRAENALQGMPRALTPATPATVSKFRREQILGPDSPGYF